MLLCDVPLGGAFSISAGGSLSTTNPPTGLFDWIRTAVPAGMNLDTKSDEPPQILSAAQDHAVQHDHAAALWHRMGEESTIVPSLRVLGTMDESINSETFDVVKEKRCSFVDILGQTVTDDCTVTPLFGVRPVVLNPADGTVVEGKDVAGGLVFSSSWTYMLRTVYGDHAHPGCVLETFSHWRGLHPGPLRIVPDY